MKAVFSSLVTYRYRVAAAVLLIVAAAALALWLMQKSPTFYAKTANGVVQGIKVEEVNAFLGIPYARPPVGVLRWKNPRPPMNWKTVLQVDTPPPHCVQTIFGMERGQEDCLYLNVWTPTLFPKKELPVMVWIHGGGFTVGHSYETTPGHRLAKQGNVVVVSINYRLGALGFMAHPELTQENGQTSGNYGLMDQVQALMWVRRNIGFFGGDRNNITIFGESAGGMSVCHLLTSPQAQGLFHKAIIESGPCFSPYPSRSYLEQQGLVMEKKLGCDTAPHKLDCMRSKTPPEILAAMPPPPGMVFGEDEVHWMPNVDGHWLLEQPAASLEAGRFARVPVINGNNADEGSLLVMFGHEYQFNKLTAEKYPDRLRYLVRDDDKVQQVMARYPLEKYPDPGSALSAAFGDHSFVCHEKWTSDALARHVPVYSYYFTYPRAEFVLPKARELGAFHSAEVQFLFGTPMAWLEKRFSGEEEVLSQSMMNYWAQFAHTGDPNGEAGSRRTSVIWPDYRVASERLRLDVDTGPVSGRDNDEVCRFWQGIQSREFKP